MSAVCMYQALYNAWFISQELRGGRGVRCQFSSQRAGLATVSSSFVGLATDRLNVRNKVSVQYHGGFLSYC